MKNYIYSLLLIPFLLLGIAPRAFAQFAGGETCSGTSNVALRRTCAASDCPANSGTFLHAGITVDNGGTLFPCTNATITHTGTVRYDNERTEPTIGNYQIIMQIEPHEHIQDFVPPTVPDYFKAENGGSATINIPSSSNISSEDFNDYNKVIHGGNELFIVYENNSGGAIPSAEFNLVVTFEMQETAPTDIGVGVSMYSSVTGNGDCQTRTATLSQPMRCAYDPNEKVAYPAGCGEKNLIAKDQKLTYFLHFQNTGSAPAIRVRLSDVLDQNLDINTLQVYGGSHPYKYQVYPGNELVFTFSPIYLPDSTADEPNSHGYVSFSIYPKKTLKAGDVISNKTEIFFDNNPAILTNTVFHTIQDEVPQQIAIEGGDSGFCQTQENIISATEAESYLWSTGDTTQQISITAPGTYWVRATFANTCAASFDTVSYWMEENIPVSIHNKEQVFCAGNTYSFKASQAQQYLWSTGETTQEITVDEPGNYWVKATSYCGVESTDTVNLVKSTVPCCATYIQAVTSYIPGNLENSNGSLPNKYIQHNNAVGSTEDLSTVAPGEHFINSAVALGFDDPHTIAKEGIIVLDFGTVVSGELTIRGLYDLNNNTTEFASADVFVSSGPEGPWTLIGSANTINRDEQNSLLFSTVLAIDKALANIRYVKLVNTTPGRQAGVFTPHEGYNVESICASAASGFASSARSGDTTRANVAVGKGKVVAYPNPFVDDALVSVEGAYIQEISVVDVNGVEVQKQKFTKATEKVLVGKELRPGFYILRVVTEVDTYTIRLIKL